MSIAVDSKDASKSDFLIGIEAYPMANKLYNGVEELYIENNISFVIFLLGSMVSSLSLMVISKSPRLGGIGLILSCGGMFLYYRKTAPSRELLKERKDQLFNELNVELDKQFKEAQFPEEKRVLLKKIEYIRSLMDWYWKRKYNLSSSEMGLFPLVLGFSFDSMGFDKRLLEIQAQLDKEGVQFPEEEFFEEMISYLKNKKNFNILMNILIQLTILANTKMASDSIDINNEISGVIDRCYVAEDSQDESSNYQKLFQLFKDKCNRKLITKMIFEMSQDSLKDFSSKKICKGVFMVPIKHIIIRGLVYDVYGEKAFAERGLDKDLCVSEPVENVSELDHSSK
ncbi:MAG: hypothetical protein K940chlam8_00668 [Chlamydiae bacterium]|nr:hypothetical protein [Chlamydiota bacterium]